jgi:hypothetical protein
MDEIPLQQARVPRGSLPTGRFKVDVVTGRWWWSDETYRIYGFEPIEVDPTTATVLAHSHPEDMDRVQSLLEGAQTTGEPFSTMHRIIDANGFDHVVLIIGEGKRDNSGDVATVDGCVTDLTIDLMP